MQEENPMTKVFRFLAICTITIAFATLSIASGQTYTQVDYPGAILTELSGGPNPEGTSVGAWQDTGGVFHGFSLTAKGVFKSLDPPGSTLTVPAFISPQGVIVGYYLDSGSVSHGFILKRGQYTSVDAPGAAGTILSGINPSGEISGSTCTDPACGNTGNSNTSESFVLSKKGHYTFFNPPGATSSSTSTVSPSGVVVGSYTDTVGELHGYLLKNGTYTTIDFPGALYSTFAGGGNAENDVAGAYNFTSSCTADCGHAFVLSNGVYTSFDYPGAAFSEGTGINPAGVIVGVFVDSSNNVHGFIRTP
jgi:hypothetical protein